MDDPTSTAQSKKIESSVRILKLYFKKTHLTRGARFNNVESASETNLEIFNIQKTDFSRHSNQINRKITHASFFYSNHEKEVVLKRDYREQWESNQTDL